MCVSDKPIVLLVEDEAILAATLETHLNDEGFAVQLAGSGAAGKAALEENQAGLVCLVTDIRLGRGMNGWELARLARERNPSLPIVYMSGDSSADWASMGVPNSIMLTKPFALAQLTTAVAQLVNAASVSC